MTEKRKGYKTQEQQTAANQRWAEKNKERRTYLSARGACKSFIRNKATAEDLDELQTLINERRKTLAEEN